MSIDAINTLLDHILLDSGEYVGRTPADLDMAVDMLLDASIAGRQGKTLNCPTSSASSHPADAA